MPRLLHGATSMHSMQGPARLAAEEVVDEAMLQHDRCVK